MSIIEVNELTRRFNNLVAVDHISFKVEKGEIFGLLGPNGAGKSTIIRMLCTLLRPTSGKARVAGFEIVKEAGKVREHIGCDNSYTFCISYPGTGYWHGR